MSIGLSNKIFLSLIFSLFLLFLSSCATLKNKTCVESEERTELRKTCYGGHGRSNCSHTSHNTKHGTSHTSHCTHRSSGSVRTCYYRKVSMQVCTRYVCNTGYARNEKKHCVKVEKSQR